MSVVTIVVKDEVNIRLLGLTQTHIDYLIDHTKIFIPSARHTALYKLKQWDGKESNIDDKGNTFLFMLPKILDLLELLGYTFKIEDKRKDIIFHAQPIDNLLLIDYGIDLRYYQVDAINSVIECKQGIISVPTSGGKTLITAALCKLYDGKYKTLTIVPSEYLVNQTYKDVSRVDINVAKISAKVTGKKREAAWKADHLIITWQTLKNNKNKVRDRGIFLYDESHICGDVMFDVMGNYLNNSHIRIGMTGTTVDEKFKREKINCHLGGDILYHIDPKELMDGDYISTVDIRMVPLKHIIDLPKLEGSTEGLDWDDEDNYLNNNKKRINKIVEMIEDMRANMDGNFLILSNAMLGKKLSKELGTDFIDKDVDTDIRTKYFEKYDTIKDYTLNATFGTVGTGVSVDNIQYVILIDVGKNKQRVIQAIGRGLRKDDVENHLGVFDFYSELIREHVNSNGDTIQNVYNFGGGTHLKQRCKIYRDHEYPYDFSNEEHWIE